MFGLFSKNNVIPRKSMQEMRSIFHYLVKINTLESWARSLKESQFPEETNKLIQVIQNKEKTLNAVLPTAFALVREAARRVLGERMFNVQILGAIILHQGRISEMKTGEGKTLTCTAAAYLNSISNNPVHIVTVNDYLAKRDAEWMEPVFLYLGRTVGYIIPNLSTDIKKEMYDRDIVYATNNELGFDYLRDNLRPTKTKLLERGYHYCIIDEVDSILVDEARTPLIISGQANDDTIKFKHSNSIISYLSECKKNPTTHEYPEDDQLEGDYKLQEKNKNISFTAQGIQKIETLLRQRNYIQGSLQDIENFEYIHYVTQSLKAHTLFHKDVDYIVNDNKVEIVDEFTGRVLSGRRYSDGLHQAIEAKENIRVALQNKTLAAITFQNFFKMYAKLSGMTGTAVTEEKEFLNIYGLDVVELPTNKPVIRDDRQDLIFVDENAKIKAIVEEIEQIHQTGQPLLIGTASIENSEKFSTLLDKKRIKHNVLNAKNHEHEAFIIAEAGSISAVTIATNMAGRGTDIKLGGNIDYKIQKAIHSEMSEQEKEEAKLQIYEMWKTNYKKVTDLGGLYVLGTERHESRRIDNQLRGRSGRQGDPGISQFYLSLDDQLLKLFGKGIHHLKNLMTKTMNTSEPLFHPLITRTMQRAQKNVEDRNFEIRKHLLDFDSVLNQQRIIIYEEREKIINSEDLILRLKNNIDIFLEPYKDIEKQELHTIIQNIETTFLIQQNLHQCSSLSDIASTLYGDIEQKENLVGKKYFNDLIKVLYLQTIDTQWQNHIANLDELRQAVYLRSYAQKNPLLEYKLEGTKTFNSMFESISHTILRNFLGMKINDQDNKAQTTLGYSHNIQLNTQHQTMSLFHNQANTNSTQNKKKPSSIAQVVRTEKVGRNQFCPCGSGKKYKYCHGSTN